jgi:hypothetical protein
MWNEGYSGLQISKVVPGSTRNSIIGKVHRLGLARMTTGTETMKQSSQMRARRIAMKAARIKKPRHRDTPPPGSAKAAAGFASVDRPVDRPLRPLPDLSHEVEILMLGARQCRSVEHSLYCGRPTCTRGFGSYCEDHAQHYYAGKPRTYHAMSDAERARKSRNMRLLWKSRADQRKKVMKIA